GCRKVVKLENLIQYTAICEHNEANRPKTCDVCYCDKTRDHDCVDAILEAKCSANDETDSLKRTLRNPCERRVCFKVKTTAPKRYAVRPNVGLIESFGTVTIAKAVNQETLWEGVNPEAIMTSKLKCVFDVTPPSNETPVR
ncbi:unnamed protein product, partial [Oppiella nova]